jgi:hypothetical protein
LTDEQIVDLLTKGSDAKRSPHKKAIGCLSADDAKAVATSVKSLQDSSAATIRSPHGLCDFCTP